MKSASPGPVDGPVDILWMLATLGCSLLQLVLLIAATKSKDSWREFMILFRDDSFRPPKTGGEGKRLAWEKNDVLTS